MPDQPIDKARKLQKLGQRLRDGFTKENPIPDKSLETVRNAVREQWEKERANKSQNSTTPAPTREQQREPEEPNL